MDGLMLFRTRRGPVVRRGCQHVLLSRDWNDLINDDGLLALLTHSVETLANDDSLAAEVSEPLPPIADQEVWAAGVTYFRSRAARIEESQEAGGGDFYDRVYDAERPELFFKATPHRVAGHRQVLRLRSDSQWIVPEPELVLVVSADGAIVGYTIGNDLSCRDIEGENPLYLPQAKIFDRCAALGPGILVTNQRFDPQTTIRLTVRRAGAVVCDDATTLAQMKRSLDDLVDYLFRDNSFPLGCLLMTGTGIVPPADFSLERGDVVEIGIDGLDVLVNRLE